MSIRPNNKLLLLLLALKAEAKPIIKKLELKLFNKYSKPYYKNDKIGLIITGVGSSNSGSELLKIVERINPRAICNIGVCGSTNKNWRIGSAFYVNKIIDAQSEEVFYPDLLVRNDLPEATLHSFDKPQYKSIGGNINYGFLVDMEGALLFKLFKDSFSPQYIQFVKVISDYLNNEYMTSEYIETRIDEALDSVLCFICNYLEFIDYDKVIPSSLFMLISELSDRIKLTRSQKIKLERIVISGYLNGKVNVLNSDYINNLNCNSKSERNIIFKEIYNEFSE